MNTFDYFKLAEDLNQRLNPVSRSITKMKKTTNVINNNTVSKDALKVSQNNILDFPSIYSIVNGIDLNGKKINKVSNRLEKLNSLDSYITMNTSELFDLYSQVRKKAKRSHSFGIDDLVNTFENKILENENSKSLLLSAKNYFDLGNSKDLGFFYDSKNNTFNSDLNLSLEVENLIKSYSGKLGSKKWVGDNSRLDQLEHFLNNTYLNLSNNDISAIQTLFNNFSNNSYLKRKINEGNSELSVKYSKVKDLFLNKFDGVITERSKKSVQKYEAKELVAKIKENVSETSLIKEDKPEVVLSTFSNLMTEMPLVEGFDEREEAFNTSEYATALTPFSNQMTTMPSVEGFDEREDAFNTSEYATVLTPPVEVNESLSYVTPPFEIPITAILTAPEKTYSTKRKRRKEIKAPVISKTENSLDEKLDSATNEQSVSLTTEPVSEKEKILSNIILEDDTELIGPSNAYVAKNPNVDNKSQYINNLYAASLDAVSSVLNATGDSIRYVANKVIDVTKAIAIPTLAVGATSLIVLLSDRLTSYTPAFIEETKIEDTRVANSDLCYEVKETPNQFAASPIEKTKEVKLDEKVDVPTLRTEELPNSDNVLYMREVMSNHSKIIEDIKADPISDLTPRELKKGYVTFKLNDISCKYQKNMSFDQFLVENKFPATYFKEEVASGVESLNSIVSRYEKPLDKLNSKQKKEIMEEISKYVTQ